MSSLDSQLNGGWEFEYLEVGSCSTKPEDTNNLSKDMENESFMGMLGSDGVEMKTNSRDDTNLSIISTSVDSGIASSFDSTISVDSSFPNSSGSCLKDYSDTLPMRIEPEYQVLECHPHPTRNHPSEFFSDTIYQVPNYSTVCPACHGVMKWREEHACTISLAVPDIQGGSSTSGMTDSSNFDRYTRAAYVDMEANRHDLTMDYAEFKDAVPSYIQSTESRYKDTLDDYKTTEELLEMKPVPSTSSNEDTESRIVDITEYIEAETVPSAKKPEYTKKNKKKKIPKETSEDTQKYKRRKDLSYESVVGVRRIHCHK